MDLQALADQCIDLINELIDRMDHNLLVSDRISSDIYLSENVNFCEYNVIGVCS